MGIIDSVKEKGRNAWSWAGSKGSAAASYTGEKWNGVRDMTGRGWEGVKNAARGTPEAAKALYQPENIVAPAKGILRGTKAFAGTRFGKVVMVSGAAIAAAVGINAGINKSSREDADFAAQQAADADALQQNIAQKRLEIRAMSADLGESNPQSNHREAVRGVGAGSLGV